MQESYLRFERLSRRFGRVQALREVTGAVASGGMLLVRGPNGSGKSTLLRCLAGLLRPDRGRIVIVKKGQELSFEERVQRVGFLAPSLGLYRELTVLENLELLARFRKVPLGTARALAAQFSLPAERKAGELSSGMLQRLRWAALLVHSPSVWLLDEPLEHLDPSGTQLCRELLEHHLEKGGLAVVASPTPLELSRNADELVLAG
jgi:heme ABC exporter ATP-binding subunit CcmA